MNKVLIDTDIISYFFKGDKTVVGNFEKYLTFYGKIDISIITYYEIMSGLLYKNANKQLEFFDDFISENNIIELTEESCLISSKLYSKLRNDGFLIDDLDLLIAGIAIENNMVLVTNNENHFSRIQGLKIENWKLVTNF